MQPQLTRDENRMLRELVRRFADEEILPELPTWEADGIVPRRPWERAGSLGLLCPTAPVELGGGGAPDFRTNVIVTHELARTGGFGVGVTLHNDVFTPYVLRYGTPSQQQRWLPGMCSGELIGAIALTEPEAGSDLAAMRTSAERQPDGSYVLNGTKTFISNGENAALVLVAARTDAGARHDGVTLFMVEKGMHGFGRSRRLAKIGMLSQDTCELVFDGVVVPEDNRVGDEGRGFGYLMEALAQERLAMAVAATAMAEFALAETVAYCGARQVFGKPVSAHQNSRFELADMQTTLEVTRTFVDRCVDDLVAGELPSERAAMAKLWATEVVGDVTDRCLQLHGGYGYMRDFPIGRLFVDARAQRIYAGTNEIMKEIVGRSMGLPS